MPIIILNPKLITHKLPVLLVIVSVLFLFVVVSQLHAWDANNRESVREYVIYMASKEGVDVEKALFFAKEESNFNRFARNTTLKEDSCGIFQINTLAHPITCEQAFNPFFNINWAIDHMAKGKWEMWYNVNKKWVANEVAESYMAMY